MGTKRTKRKCGRKMTTSMMKMDEEYVGNHHDGGGEGGGGGGGYKTLRGRKYAHLWNLVCWDSSVDIGIRYGLEGPGIEYWWGENFRTLSYRPSSPSSLVYNRYRVIPGGKATGTWCGNNQPPPSST
jgi:hypothetical protein